MAVNQTDQLQKAKIIELDEAGNDTSTMIECHFNPYEYTVTKSNSFNLNEAANGDDKPQVEFTSGGSQELRLSLVLDKYKTNLDIGHETRRLWGLMSVKKNTNLPKKRPPEVAFQWGVFYFRAFITSMTHKFTLFTTTGEPVRAHVDISFTQYIDYVDYRALSTQSGAVGAVIEHAEQIIGDERIDNVAAKVLKDPSRWREIAQHNKLSDPLSIQSGQILAIPFR